MKLKILFFGILAEVVGSDSIIIDSQPDLDHLTALVLDRFPDLKNYRYRVSVNRVLVDDNSSLNEGDEVAFLPPFAGG